VFKIQGRQIVFETYEEYLALQGLRKNKFDPNLKPQKFNPHQKKKLIKYIEIMEKYLEFDDYILDIGSRTGWASSRFQYDGYKSIAIDVQKENVDTGRKIYGHNIVLGDVHNLNFSDSSFDGIFCSHAFEHFYNRKQAVKEMSRVLRVNGILLIVVPIQNQEITNALILETAHCEYFATKKQLLSYLDDYMVLEFLETNDEFIFVGRIREI